MPYFHQPDTLTVRELCPGYTARMLHTDGLSVAHVSIQAGSLLPEHQHEHEQVTNIVEGTLEMTVGGKTFACTPGMIVSIPGNTLHSARALTDCRVIDVFRPVREDYR